MQRRISLLVGLLLAAPLLVQGQPAGPDRGRARRTLRFVLAPHVVEELGALADTLRRETVRCLIGAVQGDSAVVDLAWQPPIDASTPEYVAYQSCPSATLALWHNHLWTREPAPEYACYLSGIDIHAALRPHAPPIQIVQVTSEVACWWVRSQIAPHAREAIVLPRPGQRWGEPVQLSAAACDGALSDIAACVLLRACREGADNDRAVDARVLRPRLVNHRSEWDDDPRPASGCTARFALSGVMPRQ